MRLLIISFLIGMGVVLLRAQQLSPVIENYTYKDGLGGEAVNTIIQDRDGFIWIGAYSGLHRYDGHTFKAFPANIEDSCALSNNVVIDLIEDRDGYIWVATKSGLNRLSPDRQCFKRWFHNPDDKNALPDNDVKHLWLDQQGRVCISMSDRALYYDPILNGFIPLDTLGNVYSHTHLENGDIVLVARQGIIKNNSLRERRITYPWSDDRPVHGLIAIQDTLWLATENGLFIYTENDSEIREAFSEGHPLHGLFIYGITKYDGHIWLASRAQGVLVITSQGKIVATYNEDRSHPYALADKHTRTFCIDQLDNIWIGNYIGVSRLMSHDHSMKLYRPKDLPNTSSHTLELAVTPEGKTFFYSRWTTVHKADAIGNPAELLDFPENEYLKGIDLNQIYIDRQNIAWLLRGKDGIYRYDSKTNTFLPKITSEELSETRLSDIIQDPHDDNIYWLATSYGLCKLNIVTRKESWYSYQSNRRTPQSLILTLTADQDGRIWFAGSSFYNARIGVFDPETEQFNFLPYEPGDPDHVAGGRIKQMAVDKKNRLWVAAGQGLIEVNTKSQTATLHTQINGIHLGVLESMAILPDGDIWMSAADYLVRYHPETKKARRFQCSAIEQFTNANAAYDDTGRIYFGGKNGIISFHPDSIQETPVFPPLIIDEIAVNGKIKQKDTVTASARTLTLEPSDHLLQLQFIGLSYEPTRPIHYAYRMQGVQNEWQDLGTQRTLSFTSLSPGKYTLELRTDDGEGNWNPEHTTIKLKVKPAWYQTWLAKILFWLLGTGILSGLAYLLFRNEWARRERHHLQALDALKTRFYTNLTHEFRTPLTLLLGPAQRIKKQGQALGEPELEKEADRIDKQGRRLLHLVNNLLEVRTVELGKHDIDLESTALSGFLTQIAESFRDRIEDRGGTLSLDISSTHDQVMMDRNKVTSILTNLLDNAYKYGPDHGVIELRVTSDDAHWSIHVLDQGPGLSDVEKQNIFDRFYRADEKQAQGSGIGLSLVKELCDVLDAEISVHDAPTGGTCMSVLFPLIPVQAAAVTINPDVINDQSIAHTTIDTRDNLVLLVEDEQDVADYIIECLKEYQVVHAQNGVEGQKEALALVPDLIVSDVMMPKMDGFALTQALKQDKVTSHIPVLLLTAKHSIDDRKSGYKHGADAYLAKPFDEEELKLRLQNLLLQRERIRAHYSRAESIKPSEILTENAEDQFMQNVFILIDEERANQDLTVEWLAHKLAMSRTQLHRKLTALSGQSPGKLIQSRRLSWAAVRITETQLDISEIAYAAGYNDPAYFSRAFKQMYGQSPSVYRSGFRV